MIKYLVLMVALLWPSPSLSADEIRALARAPYEKRPPQLDVSGPTISAKKLKSGHIVFSYWLIRLDSPGTVTLDIKFGRMKAGGKPHISHAYASHSIFKRRSAYLTGDYIDATHSFQSEVLPTGNYYVYFTDVVGRFLYRNPEDREPEHAREWTATVGILRGTNRR